MTPGVDSWRRRPRRGGRSSCGATTTWRWPRGRSPGGSSSRSAAGRSRSASRSRLGHKVALTAIEPGSPVRKYGQIIGFASKPIAAGAWVHVHNVKADLFERDYAYASERAPAPPTIEPRTFRGYLRPDGRVGTRNYVAVISTVNCSASTSKAIADRFRDDAWRARLPQRRRGLRDHPQGGLRPAVRRPRPRAARAGPRRLRQPSQRGRVRDRRPRVRGQLCEAPGRGARPGHDGDGQAATAPARTRTARAS